MMLTIKTSRLLWVTRAAAAMSTKPQKLVEQQHLMKANKQPEKKQSYTVQPESDDETNPLSQFWSLKVDEFKKTTQTPPQVEESEVVQPVAASIEEEDAVKSIKFEELSCTGCGVQLQYQDDKVLGFLPKFKVIEHFKKVKELKAFEANQSAPKNVKDSDKELLTFLKKKNVSAEVIKELERHQSSERIGDLDTLLMLDQAKGQANVMEYSEFREKEKTMNKIEKSPNNLICQRCFQLKHQHKLVEYTPPPSNLTGVPTALAHHVQKMDREKILRAILDKIYPRSVILMVVDMANFEGSLIPEIFENVNHKKHKLIIL